MPRIFAEAAASLLRRLLIVGLLLAAGRAEAQAETTAEVRLRAALSAHSEHPGRFAHAASWVGLFAGAALLSGSITIAVLDDRASERTTRSLHFGLAALSSPFVALGGWTARRRAKVQGYEAIRKLGWSSYAAAMALGARGLYSAFNDLPEETSLTVVTGVLATLSVLPLAFDAYVCARQARLAHVTLVVTPLGISGRF